MNYDTVVTVLTNIEERKTIVENIAFSEVRTAVQRCIRNYIYRPQTDGYLRFNFYQALAATRENMLRIIHHVLPELSSFKFMISVDCRFIQYHPGTGEIVECEIY